MPILLIFEREYFSPADESAFFRWLSSIPGVTQTIGTPAGLEVTLRSRQPGDVALRELLALHFRYGLPMKDLAQYKSERNSAWFASPTAYWHEAVFGPDAISPNIEARLMALRKKRLSPVQAIKTIRTEYRLSLGEAKRRLNISSAWREHAKASAPLQANAMRLATLVPENAAPMKNET
jgi:hypothetical protein